MKTKIILLLSLSFLILFSCKEEKKIDLKTINVIQQLQKNANTTSVDSMQYYLLKINKLFNSYKNIPDSLKAENEYLKGRYFDKNNMNDSAYFYFERAINYSKDSIPFKRGRVHYLYYAERYLLNGDYKNSLGVLNQFENSIGKKNNYKYLGDISNKKKRIYSLLENYEKSSDYNNKAIEYYSLANDSINQINSIIYQSNLYYFNLNNKERAYHLLDSIAALKFWSAYNLKVHYYQVYGTFNFLDKKYDDSYESFLQVAAYMKKSPTTYGLEELTSNYVDMTEILTLSKKYKIAQKYIDTITIYSKDLNPTIKTSFLQNKLKLSFLTKRNYDSITSDFEALYTFMNSSYERRIDDELKALIVANQKEKELLITNQNIKIKNLGLKQNQLILFSIAGILFLGIIIGILFFRQRKLQFSKEELLLQQRLFRSQMNPHFTSNILYSIQNLFKTDRAIANTYLVKFSRLLRITLLNSTQNYGALENEIEALTKYLDLQQLRFPDKFEYQIDIQNFDKEIRPCIPPMLIQPFVENCIEHAFKNIDYKGKIKINLQLKDDFVLCKIEDNGIGVAKLSSKNDKSTSTELIKQFLKRMTKQEIEIINKGVNSNEKGTIIQFNIPFKLD